MPTLSASNTGGVATQAGQYDPNSFQGAPAGSYEAQLYDSYKNTTPMSSSVVTSKPAVNDLANIQQEHQNITQGMNNQANTVANYNAARDAENERQRQVQAQQQSDQDSLTTERQKNGLPPLDMSNELDSEKAQRQSLIDDYTTQSKSVQDTIQNIQNGSVPLSAGEQAQIQGLQQQFNQLIQQQTLANTQAIGSTNMRGYQKGSAEYDPTFQVNTIGSIITAGNNKVADLNIKMASAVADMTQNFKDKKIQSVKDAFVMYKDLYDKRQEVIKDTIGETTERIKTYQKQIDDQNKAKIAEDKQVQDDISKAVLDAGKGGAPKELLAKAAKEPTLAGAVGVLGEYLNTTSGIIGEYTYYKRQAEAQGLTPLSFEQYQDADANRKRLAASAADDAGLTTRESVVFNSIIDKYNRSPLAMAKDRTPVLRATIDNVNKDPSNAAQQLNLAYSYVQALDTYQSAVREGELSLVNSIDSKVGQVQNYISQINNGQIVRPEVATQIAEAAKTIADTIDSAAEKNKKKYQAQAKANGSSVENAFNDFLDTYSSTTTEALTKQKDDATVIQDYFKTAPPEEQEFLNELYTTTDPKTGAQLTDQQIVDWLRRNKKVSFNNVGSDTKLASGVVGGYDITSYATDPNHEKNVSKIYDSVGNIESEEDADNYIRSIAPNSPVSGKYVIEAAEKYDVDPALIMAIMQQDSSFGTKGKAVKTKNPGNVGNDDSGKTVDMGTWKNGVLEVAKNLSRRRVNNLS